MSGIVFIGDELSATGFRLTGIETIVPKVDQAAVTLASACKRAELVILTAALAGHIPPNELEAALASEAPVVAIIPDVLFHEPFPDLARRLRTILGIEN